MLAFHALTGCDVASFLAGVTKSSAWRIFKVHGELLSGVGVEPLDEQCLKEAERFVTRLYKIDDLETVDAARYALFGRKNTPKTLPPTSDALRQHILRAHFQTAVWKNAHIADPDLPAHTDCGWSLEDGDFKSILTTIEAVPKACIDLVSCGCKTGCSTRWCGCRRAKPNS